LVERFLRAWVGAGVSTGREVSLRVRKAAPDLWVGRYCPGAGGPAGPVHEV
jgi:hypothetical protein